MKVVHETGVRIATLHGDVIVLEPGVVTELPAHLVRYTLAEGAEIVGEYVKSQLETKFQNAVPEPLKTVEVVADNPTPYKESDHERLVRVMKEIIARGDVSDFRTDQQPKNAILNRQFGRVVTQEEREKAWAEATTVVAPAS